ncbi:MAG: hypothetical protein HKN42_14150 [Granulosicoccus sp.]|nr:hypothetical protein [Granulosicoccus sp.]
MTQVVQGYAEGYYGKLFEWSDRHTVLATLAAQAQNTYYYAPKEDSLHRLRWREPYGQSWRADFSRFCDSSRAQGVQVVAGVAPGLDFDFAHLNGGADLQALVRKCRQLIDDGAGCVSLLLDDIDENFRTRSGGIASEGHAHARLANVLGDELGRSLWVTPRIYANELAVSAPDYLPDFLSTLHEEHSVLYCGSDIVARRADPRAIQDVAPAGKHSLVLWDNLYANDYCPQRLFTGPWCGRETAGNVLLNPTGLLHTDCLLLDMMASFRTTVHDPASLWRKVMSRHGVPEAFNLIGCYFGHPVFNGEASEIPEPPTPEVFDAFDECLWRWKTPLSREWYSFLFSVKLDLLIERGSMSALRIRKTQSIPQARRLLAGSTS